jgi:hypothetical protein
MDFNDQSIEMGELQDYQNIDIQINRVLQRK